MSESVFSEKRRRGVLLSFQGWQRLQSAEQLVAVQQNGGNPFTLDQLSQTTGLSPNTLTKVRRRQKPVDFATLETYFAAFDLILEPTDLVAPEAHMQSSEVSLVQRHPPRGSLPLGSPFYVYRPPIERVCFQEVLYPGSLLRIKAPRQYGKTSLITQISGYANDHGLASCIINLQMVEGEILSKPDAFLRWLCGSVARSLDIPNNLEEYWNEMFGAGYSCTQFFESVVISTCDRPLVLALDGFDELFYHRNVAIDVCGLIRAWYELARYGSKQEIWQKLRIVIAHVMEVRLPLNLHQSPFNVGVTIELPGFDLYQTQEIASRYELDFSEEDARQLRQLIDGHPFLTQLTLYHLSQGADMGKLLGSAIAFDGIFSSHLRRQLQLLETDANMLEAMALVAKSPDGVKLHPSQASFLQGLGLVKFDTDKTLPSCELYRQYFSRVLDIE